MKKEKMQFKNNNISKNKNKKREKSKINDSRLVIVI